MVRHVNIRITGRVQGVYFRASAKGKAIGLALKGFVRNEPNGDVYVEAEGTPEDIEKFIGWSKIGPGDAVVEMVHFEDSAVKGFERFEIKR